MSFNTNKTLRMMFNPIDTKLSVIIFLSFVWLVIDYHLYLYLNI